MPGRELPAIASKNAADETFDLAAAGLRADGTDLRISVEVLAAKLEQRCPGARACERRGGGLLGRGEKHVRQIQVELGSGSGTRYQLTIDGDRVEGFRERRSAASRSSASRWTPTSGSRR